VAKAAAGGLERFYAHRGGAPPLTRLTVWVSALECTLDISRARAELQYEPVTSIDAGMAELSAAGT
jgi:nucleoside-diphosphate-sugar epimerase